MKQEYIKTSEAAKQVGFKTTTIEMYCRTKKIKAKKLGRVYLISITEWEEWKLRNIKDVA